MLLGEFVCVRFVSLVPFLSPHSVVLYARACSCTYICKYRCTCMYTCMYRQERRYIYMYMCMYMVTHARPLDRAIILTASASHGLQNAPLLGAGIIRFYSVQEWLTIITTNTAGEVAYTHYMCVKPCTIHIIVCIYCVPTPYLGPKIQRSIAISKQIMLL